MFQRYNIFNFIDDEYDFYIKTYKSILNLIHFYKGKQNNTTLF